MTGIWYGGTAMSGGGGGSPTGPAGGQLGGTYPNPDVRGIRETGGPTLLTIGAVLDGQVLARSGAAVVGVAAGSVTDGDKGDITVSVGGTVWTIDNDVVTYAKMQNVSAASRLLGRGDAGAGDVQELTLGTGLAITGTVLDAVATPHVVPAIQNANYTANINELVRMKALTVSTITATLPLITAAMLGKSVVVKRMATSIGDVDITHAVGNTIDEVTGVITMSGTGASSTFFATSLTDWTIV